MQQPLADSSYRINPSPSPTLGRVEPLMAIGTRRASRPDAMGCPTRRHEERKVPVAVPLSTSAPSRYPTGRAFPDRGPSAPCTPASAVTGREEVLRYWVPLTGGRGRPDRPGDRSLGSILGGRANELPGVAHPWSSALIRHCSRPFTYEGASTSPLYERSDGPPDGEGGQGPMGAPSRAASAASA